MHAPTGPAAQLQMGLLERSCLGPDGFVLHHLLSQKNNWQLPDPWMTAELGALKAKREKRCPLNHQQKHAKVTKVVSRRQPHAQSVQDTES